MLYIVGKNYNALGEEMSKAYLEYVFQNQLETPSNYNNLLKQIEDYSNEEGENAFFLINEEEIIGCCRFALQRDPITQKKFPCITTLYIKEDYRGHSYGQLLINHVIHQAKVQGFDSAYVMAENSDYYTSQNWTEVSDSSFEYSGKIYCKNLNTHSYYCN